MPKRSAGLLLFRRVSGRLEVLLVHPGGPFWVKKDEGAWSIPKGEVDEDEDLLAAAKREFEEETGFTASGDALPLGALRQPSGKVILVWAVEGDLDPSGVRSNTFSVEWPPKSGLFREFPEIDRAAWLSMEAAQGKILKGQAPFLLRLVELLDERESTASSPSKPPRT